MPFNVSKFGESTWTLHGGACSCPTWQVVIEQLETVLERREWLFGQTSPPLSYDLRCRFQALCACGVRITKKAQGELRLVHVESDWAWGDWITSNGPTGERPPFQHRVSGSMHHGAPSWSGVVTAVLARLGARKS